MPLLPVPLPSPTQPFVGPDGLVTQPWYRAIQVIFERTGGVTGNGVGGGIQSPDLTALQASLATLSSDLATLDARSLLGGDDDSAASVSIAALAQVNAALADMQILLAAQPDPDPVVLPDFLVLGLLSDS